MNGLMLNKMHMNSCKLWHSSYKHYSFPAILDRRRVGQGKKVQHSFYPTPLCNLV